MPFRARFDCLWCGTAWETGGPTDLEGWAQLCPTCLGRAGENPFLRARLRSAIADRGAAAPAPGPGRRPGARPFARALPDEWFLRRGPFEHGAVHDAAWQAELDVVTLWLDAQPLAGRILEPAAGVGFFSPLLAGKGELHASDADGDALGRARDRLVAHRLLAHLHEADPWAAPEPRTSPRTPPGTSPPGDPPPATPPGAPPADALVAAFMLGRVRGAGLDAATTSFRARLRRGGRLAVIDLRPDPFGGPPDDIAWTWHDPALLEASLSRAGFTGIEVRTTGRFFILVAADAG